MTNLSDIQSAEIERARRTLTTTRRSVSEGLEEIIFQAIPVLDHGFVRVIDYMGDDAAVVQAARVSYGRGTREVSEDRGLIHYLLRHWHTTPFEMAEIKLHVKMPIFVARQWIRHRMANVNEYSARYSVLDREFYLPAPEQLAVQSTQNRQGRGDVLRPDEAAKVLSLLKADAERNYDHYLEMLNYNEDGERFDEGRPGLARELARINLSLNFYTQWYWKTDLHNLMNFLRLRADRHAQYEIRAYADVILDLMKKWVPLSYDAFREHRLEAATFSGEALKALRRMLAGERVEQSQTAMSKREWNEFLSKLDLS
ncbi:FAD-dependent thymidylate synthase [Rhizobium sp. Leaf386]|uniref:FAD-dependent thymidylate synthase n=1 Tax=Rhizobium sp. Leaf386 TaxID=1736359 RepID=UPI000713089D|nr:FAD-dependent thymidylate synthase [Rhizobium sp. Leaf386]KQT03319.1 FAD-dependent thymidylate synthase [Rhizobium sp. Leaf386]